MAETPEGKKGGWTEADKLGLLFQIIERSGTIKWATLTLPEGRSRHACAVMISNEKKKVKDAKAATGIFDDKDTVSATPKSDKRKRDGEDAAGGAQESPTPRTPAKKSRGRPKKAKDVSVDETKHHLAEHASAAGTVDMKEAAAKDKFTGTV